jgi:translin
MSLKRILGSIERHLKERATIREELIDAMRKAIRFSKQAIFSVHKGQFDDAEKALEGAKGFLSKLDKIPVAHQKLAHTGVVNAAFQEYVEANVFFRLTQDGKLVSPSSLNAPPSSYLLGLADVIGELRRRALDLLRMGNVKGAVKSLETMEYIYDEIVVMDAAFHIVPELRRKSDIARRIIEATRGDVTVEVRRDSLRSSLYKLEKAIRSGKKLG